MKKIKSIIALMTVIIILASDLGSIPGVWASESEGSVIEEDVSESDDSSIEEVLEDDSYCMD